MKLFVLSIILYFLVGCGANYNTGVYNQPEFPLVCGTVRLNPWDLVPFNRYQLIAHYGWQYGWCTYYTDGRGGIFYDTNLN
jgi:hypothetical protein